MEEIRIDLSKATPEEIEQGINDAQLCFKLNHTMPYSEEYDDLVKQIFGESCCSSIHLCHVIAHTFQLHCYAKEV